MMMRAASDYFRATFGLDLRSLAAMRVGLAGVVLTDLAIRASDFEAMYSSAGMAPVEFVRSLQRTPVWSLHLLSGNDGWQAFLFGLATCWALAMLVGFRTRLAVVASWLLLTSVQMRMPLALNAGDTLLRVALFWSMFLPLGAVWSFDARRRTAGRRDEPSGSPEAAPLNEFANPLVSAASVALIVQLAIVYWFAGWAKWNDAWLRDDALSNVFKFGLYGLPLGASLDRYPALTQFVSRATVWFELAGPLLLFIPWRPSLWRMIAFAGFVLLHAFIAATMTVGLFSYAAIAVWMGMLPSEFWDRFPRLRLPVDERGVPNRSLAMLQRTRARAAGVICALSLVVVVYWNVINEISPKPINSADRLARAVGHIMGLRQSWGVFGHPPRRDMWFVYQARLSNGEAVDLLSGGRKILDRKPQLASRQFANHRWRKLHLRLRSDSTAPYRQAAAEYLLRRWNADHGPDEQVVRLDFYCYTQEFDLAGNPEDRARKTLAQIVVGAEGGNFAEALRDDGAF